MITFRHAADKHEYQALDDGRVVGTIDYHDDGSVRVMTHTETDPAMQGQGIAGQMTRFALDDVRRSGCSVRPECSYVVEWIKRHPEYSDVEA